MAESEQERKRRQKADRMRRWRLRKKLGEQPGDSQALVLPDEPPAGDSVPWPAGLPQHMANPVFGELLQIGVETLSEAHRYTRYVQGMAPGEALKPLRPGASPPASEARLQRQAAVQVLAQMAATPISAIRVMRDASGAFDLAAEAAAITERRSEKFPGAYVADNGEFVIPPADDEDGDGPTAA